MNIIEKDSEIYKDIRILYVEDDLELREMTFSFLKILFPKTHAVTNGAEGLDLFKKNIYDIILTDIRMPVMNGIKFISEIRKITETQRIIISSAYFDENDLMTLINLGVSKFLKKPTPIMNLRNLLFTTSDEILKEIEFKTLRKEYEQLLRKDLSDSVEKQSLLSEVVKQSFSAVVITDLEGKIEYVNKKFMEYSEYSMEELIGNNPRVIKSGLHDPDYYKNIWDDLNSGKNWVGEFHNKKKSGKIYTVLANIVPIKNNKGETTHYAGIHQDITYQKKEAAKRKKNEEIVKKSNEDLIIINKKLQDMQNHMMQQEKMASIGQLAAGIAHEINNPTGFIMSNLRSFKEYVADFKDLIAEYKKLDPSDNLESIQNKLKITNALEKEIDIDFLLDDVDDLLKESIDGADRIKDIVQNLRNFARLDQTEEFNYININDAIESTLKIVWNEIKYVSDVKKDFEEVKQVYANGGLLNQVFTNILVNAAQAIGSCKVNEKGLIKIKTYEENDKLLIEIVDNGCGMPDNIIKKIYEPFFTTKEVGKGTGLGLNISYDIVVNKHNGELICTSELDKGTTFKIILPIDKVKKQTK